MSKASILFRADGNSEIGLGHIYRCVSLMDILGEWYDFKFITKCTLPEIIETISRISTVIQIRDNTNEIEIVREIAGSNDIMVIDGYQFDYEFQNSMRSLGLSVVVIDDNVAEKYDADVIINHGNKHIINQYKNVAQGKVYTGFEYLILRKEFLNLATVNRKLVEVDSVVICFGGADPFNCSKKALESCLKKSWIKEINVITGAAYIHEDLEQIIRATHYPTIKLFKNQTADEIIELLTQSHIAICPASTIALEVCCAKLGLLTGKVVDNQENILRGLLDSKCAVSVGDFLKCTVDDIADRLDQFRNVVFVNEMVSHQTINFTGHSAVNIAHIFDDLLVK